MRRDVLTAALTCVACLCACLPLNAAQRYDPRLRFRVLATRSFDIYYHEREEGVARRLAAIAEDVAARLEPQLGRPSRRVGVILVDQTDLANGWATPVPYNLIEITAAGPPGSSIIGNTGDWLRLVFTHEYTHVLHLDRSRGLFGGLRRVFGRSPVLFPNLFLPTWQIEGIATYQESAGTLQGRVHAGDARAIVQVAAAAGQFAGLDRASNLLVDWPSGNTPYIYGGFFHQYLAERYGPESIARLRDATAGRVPHFGAGAFKKVFGRSLGDLWADFEAATRRAAADAPVLTSATRLTAHGFTVMSPVFAGDGRLFYSVVNPHGFPSLMERRADGTSRRVTRRFLGNRISSAGTLLVFDELEYERNVGLLSDLYAIALDGSGRRRLTRGARAADPDVSRDGRTIVCTVQSADRRALATLALPPPGSVASPVELVSEAGTEFYAPRWSPDGRSIVAERRRPGAPYDIIVIDVSTKRVRSLFAAADGRAVGPMWLPDGRTVLFSSDRNGRPLRLLSVDVTTNAFREAGGTGPEAHSPALSPDGRMLVYVGYSADGHDLYELPLADMTWTDHVAVKDAESPVPSQPPADVVVEDRAYRPSRTLLPTFWTPVVEKDEGEWVLGAASGGMDALGRHAYGGSLGWSVNRARPDVLAAYVYDRWRPTLFVQASDDTDPFADGEFRSTELDAGALFPVRRTRWAAAGFAAIHASTDTLDCPSCEAGVSGTDRRRAVRFGASVDTSRRYGYSISPESGGMAVVSSEIARRAFGSGGDAHSMAADARWYVPVWPRHAALALRAAGAASWGDETARRQFSAAGGDPRGGGFRFGFDAIGLMRGFDESDVFGSRAGVVNVDYRFPLRHVERGIGTLPVFLRNIHGAVFADAGSAWDSSFRSAEIRRAFGAELSADVVFGYALPLTVTGGAAWRDDPVAGRRGWATFARIGRAF